MARSDSNDQSSDSSKKVARAARAGQTRSSASGSEKRDIGFPLAMAAVIFLGVALVVFARQTRDASALTPSFTDHWHLAYGIYDCRTDSFLPNLADPQTPNSGIHSHGDGVIHLHPRSSDATGVNAKVERFLEAVRVSIDGDSEMSFPDREALSEDGAECDGQPAILQIARFAPGSDTPSEVATEDLLDFRFLENQESIVFALAPEGAAIPNAPRENIELAAADSGLIVGTDGVGDLSDLDLGGNDLVGVDEDGNVIDAEGNILVPADQIVPEEGEDTPSE